MLGISFLVVSREREREKKGESLADDEHAELHDVLRAAKGGERESLVLCLSGGRGEGEGAYRDVDVAVTADVGCALSSVRQSPRADNKDDQSDDVENTDVAVAVDISGDKGAERGGSQALDSKPRRGERLGPGQEKEKQKGEGAYQLDGVGAAVAVKGAQVVAKASKRSSATAQPCARDWRRGRWRG